MTIQRFNRAVVLGAGGFLGINLVAALVKRGFSVVCFDRNTCLNWPAGVRILVGDLTVVQPELLAAMDNAFVFHLASSAKPTSRTDAIAFEIEGEISATVRLLEASKNLNTRWIYLSSGGTVYGQIDTSALISENSRTLPMSSYGIAKLAVERYFSLYRKIHGTAYSIARVANPYGPWQSPLAGQGIIGTLIYKAIKKEPIEIWGDGENVRDYLYVDDVIGGLLQIAEYGESGEIYNLGSQAGVSVNTLIALVQIAACVDLNVNYVPARASDVRYSVLDTQKLLNLGPWKPTTSLETGISLTVRWMHENMALFCQRTDKFT